MRARTFLFYSLMCPRYSKSSHMVSDRLLETATWSERMYSEMTYNEIHFRIQDRTCQSSSRQFKGPGGNPPWTACPFFTRGHPHTPARTHTGTMQTQPFTSRACPWEVGGNWSPWRNPHRQGENVQTPHRQGP